MGMSGWSKAEDNRVAGEEIKELRGQDIAKTMHKNPEIAKY